MSKVLSVSDGANPNYLCKIIRVANLRKHPNADRLLVFNVDGNDVITSTDTKEGQLSIYFPLEVSISPQYLSVNDEYRKNLLLNSDKDSGGGFFEEKGRVKAVKLRGQKSMGYVVPVETISYLIGDHATQGLATHVGEEFDTIDGTLLAWKYVVPQLGTKVGKNNAPKALHEMLIANQFRLHYDTSQLGKNLHQIQPNSSISITWKLHGTSWVSGKVLAKRKLKWHEKFAKKLGVKVVESEYANIYSSRKVIKSEHFAKSKNHYYSYDIWSDINDRFKDNLLEGETLYGEAVGFDRDGGFIQKGFDYKCEAKQHKVYVYRITHTSAKGHVIDLPFNMVQERCEQLGTETVPLIFLGKASNFTCMDGSLEGWRNAFFQTLSSAYVRDQDSQFCNNKVPEEGVVVRIEGLTPIALKLKAFRFLEGESKQLDKGEVNIEDIVDAE